MRTKKGRKTKRTGEKKRQASPPFQRASPSRHVALAAAQRGPALASRHPRSVVDGAQKVAAESTRNGISGALSPASLLAGARVPPLAPDEGGPTRGCSGLCLAFCLHEHPCFASLHHTLIHTHACTYTPIYTHLARARTHPHTYTCLSMNELKYVCSFTDMHFIPKQSRYTYIELVISL